MGDSERGPCSLEELYNEAYALVEQGICYDEVGHRDGALAMYERGLQLIDRAGQLPGAEQSRMYHKMLTAREHILYRLKDLRSGADGAAGSEADLTPPPYHSIEQTIEAFGDAKSADELFVIPGGCFSEGEETTVPSYPASLRIFKFKADEDSRRAAASSEPPAFMQVGDWIYPLVPGRSPVLHSSYGAYIFPNPTVDDPELYVGVLLPSDLERNAVELFENLMKEYTSLHVQTTATGLSEQESGRLSAKISRLLVSTAEFVVWGIEKGTDKTSELISKHSESFRKGDKTDKPVVVDPRVQTSVHYLRKGSKVAVKVSGYLVDKIGKIAIGVGKHVASYAEKNISSKSSKTGAIVHDTMEVVAGGITGMATVYMGMEKAAKVLAKNIANETVLVVDHKYGAPAAEVTNDALYAAGHGGGAAWNIYNLGPKAILKRSAKQAGVEVLKDLGGSKNKASKAPKEGSDTEIKQL